MQIKKEESDIQTKKEMEIEKELIDQQKLQYQKKMEQMNKVSVNTTNTNMNIANDMNMSTTKIINNMNTTRSMNNMSTTKIMNKNQQEKNNKKKQATILQSVNGKSKIRVKPKKVTHSQFRIDNPNLSDDCDESIEECDDKQTSDTQGPLS